MNQTYKLTVFCRERFDMVVNLNFNKNLFNLSNCLWQCSRVLRPVAPPPLHLPVLCLWLVLSCLCGSWRVDPLMWWMQVPTVFHHDLSSLYSSPECNCFVRILHCMSLYFILYTLYSVQQINPLEFMQIVIQHLVRHRPERQESISFIYLYNFIVISVYLPWMFPHCNFCYMCVLGGWW